MDLETENRIAALLLKEAAELRRQAEEEGVLGYLRKPKVRGRPNSRFLTATVLGVQQANRAVEENEMWRAREKELGLDKRLNGRFREESSRSRYYNDVVSDSERNRRKRHTDAISDSSSLCLLEEKDSDNGYLREDEGLRDDEVEEFLQSRIKRGRGDVGSRMDETGPYLPCKDSNEKCLATSNMQRWEAHGNDVFYGPKKPALLDMKKAKKKGSSKQHSEKRKSKDKSKEKTREEERKKHRKN